MLNANIPLSGHNPNTANALFQATQAAENSKQNALNRDLTKERIASAQGQNRDAEQDREMFSITKGAIDTLGFIENNDVQGLNNYYAARQKEIESRGGNAQDTIVARQLLQSGDVDGLRGKAEQVISGAEQLGIIKGHAQNSASLSKSFQQGVDENGNLVFFRGSDAGGVERLQGITPHDPVQRKVAEQTAIQTQTPQGIAATQKAESDALSAEAKAREKTVQVEKGKEVKQSALGLVNDLLAEENLGGTLSQFGAIDSKTFNLTGSANTAAAKLEQLQDILTSDNLGLMTGVLSESDLKVIANISGGGLNRKLSDDEALKNLRELQRKLRNELDLGDPESLTNLSDEELFNF